MKNIVFYLSIFIVSFLEMFTAIAQSQTNEKAELIGCIRDDFGSPVKNAVVFNETKGEILNTGLLGDFRMNISPGDTLAFISDNYNKKYFVVPKVENPFVFQDFTLQFNREAALANYQRQKMQPVSMVEKADEEQTVMLAGRVVSANGNALVDVNITIGNSLGGTVSNKHGVYEIEVSSGDSVYFSHVGHRSQGIFVIGMESDVVMKDVMLVPTAFMLQGVRVTANKALLNLQYDKTSMDVGEVSKYTLRNHAMQTDKTYFPTFGISTASFGGLSSIFGGKKGKDPKKVSQKVLDRQAIMREKVLEMENNSDSTFTSEGNL